MPDTPTPSAARRACSHGPDCQLPWSVHDWSYEAERAAGTEPTTAATERQGPAVFCATHRDTEIVTEAGGPDMPTIHGRRYCPVCQEKLMEALDGEA